MCLLDVDDLWLPEKLEYQLGVAVGFDVVGTLAEYFGDRSGLIPIKAGEIQWNDLIQLNHIVNSSAMIHRSDAHWECIEGIEGYAMWLRLGKSGRSVYNVPVVLVRHRLHPTSAFNTKSHDVESLRRRWR